MRIVVLASGTGSLLESLLAHQPVAQQLVAVVADRPCRALTLAQAANLPTSLVAPNDHADRAAWNKALASELADYQPDWLVSAGFMRILGEAVLAAFPQRIINTHPALLPSFPGAHAVQDALGYGVKVTGCTVHLVDAGVDTGPIIAQAAVSVDPVDDEATLHERIKEVERRLLIDVIEQLPESGFVTDERRIQL